MTSEGAGALVLLAAGLALIIWPEELPARIEAVCEPSGDRGNGSDGRAGAGPTGGRRAGRQLLRTYAPVAGLPVAAALWSPGWWWYGVLAAVPLSWYLGRRVGRPTAAQLRERRRELAGRLDLIAACLTSGLPISSALAAVAGACSRDQADRGGGGSVPTPVDLLEEAAAMLMVGADPQTAWRSAAAHPDLTSVAAAACRSAAGGTALSAAFTEQATQLRRQNTEADADAAGRAGVLMTAPLGACFLPAFLCLGLAPAVVGLLGTLHLW